MSCIIESRDGYHVSSRDPPIDEAVRAAVIHFRVTKSQAFAMAGKGSEPYVPDHPAM